ncbi:MAG: CDGSH iron-sulfur domain-containing protein [Chitinispirillales bacterium]|jgi:CDGSH-type Zn-finger protein|nr:CDGSH iron-sulfur domain-containing protein [Chitinispirillales bacterium]
MNKEIYVKVTNDGPYLVYGIPKIEQKIIEADEHGISIRYGNGKTFEIKSDPSALCRCGKSQNAPFCDSTHIKVKFKGKETTGFEPILDGAEEFDGPNLTLADNQDFCAYARFCDAKGSIWKLIFEGTKESDDQTVKEANNCPSGRLLLFNKEGKPVEHDLSQSIAAIEDRGLGISGPLWIQGKIRVESEDGQSYEIRNRQTLCRCGASARKPFCSGSHASVEFKAHYPK